MTSRNDTYPNPAKRRLMQPCKPGCMHLEPHALDECQTRDEFRETVEGSRCANTPTPIRPPVKEATDMADATSRTVLKSERKRLAKAELLLNAAVTVQRWADDLTGKNATAPMSEWGADDPFVSLCRRYDLTPADLAKLAEGLAEQLEARAERAGYAEAWL